MTTIISGSSPSITFSDSTTQSTSANITAPYTSNGVVYASSTSALATGSNLVFDGSNLGLGVTPSAWGSINGGAIQMGAGYTSLYSYSNAATLGSNVYYTTAGHKYFASGVGASAYQQLGGNHYWISAGSGTAGNTISFTQPLAVGKGTTLVLENGTSSSGTGIAFPATQNNSSDANTLDDYEEGTWTPNFVNNGSTSNWSSKVGRYVKIGQQVTIWFYNGGGGSSNGGSGSGAIALFNLPFSVSYGATLSNQQAIAVVGGSNTNQPGLDWLLTGGGSGTIMQVYYNPNGNQEQGNLTYASGVWTYLTST
jgi:hypothetical protein